MEKYEDPFAYTTVNAPPPAGMPNRHAIKDATPVRRIVAGLGVRNDDVGLAVEEARDVIHLDPRGAGAVHDENGPLLWERELLQDLERLLRCSE